MNGQSNPPVAADQPSDQERELWDDLEQMLEQWQRNNPGYACAYRRFMMLRKLRFPHPSERSVSDD